MTDFNTIVASLRQFNLARGWNASHNSKDLAIALTVEASELLELFQWLTPEQSNSFGPHLDKTQIESEMADVLIYLINLALRLDVNLLDATVQKIAINSQKYPVQQNE